MSVGLTRGAFLCRGGAAIGVVVLAPLRPLRRLGLDASAVGVFADEATFLFDPGAVRFEPDPSVWTQEGRLDPIAVPDRGLGAEGVGSTLSYTHVPPPLPDGLGAGLRAQLVAPFVPDDSGAWLDDAISPRLTVDDGRVQVSVVPARDAVTFERVLRVGNAAVELRLPFPWDNGYGNLVDIDRRADGKVAVTATNLDPAADGRTNTLLIDDAVLPSSDGRVKVTFFWDREGRTDSDSSCWVRVASLWGGQGWGAVTIPRIGQEVIVDFLEGDPDKPIVVGTVYDAEELPPFPLPADPVSDAWTIRTSSGGGYHNTFQSIPDQVKFHPGRPPFFDFKAGHDGREQVEMRFFPIRPPLVWGLELEARKDPSLFPIALSRPDPGAPIESVLHVELQIGDMTGSQTYPLRGSDGELTFRSQ
jgi:type VI secretion system (T6SS) baseplate-like injector VgrG